MLKNNNQGAVKRLTRRLVKNNRVRNIFAIIAIILTTYMISTIFSVGLSFSKNYTIMSNRIAGTLSSMTLNNPTPEQLETIKGFSGIKTAGTQINAGFIPSTNEEESDAPLQTLAFYDSAEFEKNFLPCVSDPVGTYPQAENEIMMSLAALKKTGIEKPELGMDIPLQYTDNNGQQRSETFRLSGYYTDYTKYNRGTPVSFVSETYCRANALTLEQNGLLSISAGSMSRNSLYENIKQNAGLHAGQEVTTDFNPMSESLMGQVGALGIIVMLVLFIVLSGYLLIYNVIYISVTKDIRFYGLLKTIGTSPKQIKKLVRNQIYLLSVIGIPIGIGLALASSFAIVPFAMKVFESESMAGNLMPSEVSFNPLIFIGTAFFALLTIALSSRKPAKVAASVAPVEALKYTGITPTGKIKDHSGTKGGKPHKIAWYNIFREKKRAVLVFASLFMGTITFLTINCFINSLGVENYIDRYYPNDFEIDNLPPLEQDFSDSLIQSLKEIDGVKDVKISQGEPTPIKFDESVLEPLLKMAFDMYYVGDTSDGSDQITPDDYNKFLDNFKNDPEKSKTWLNGIELDFLEKYNKNHKEKLDIDAFERGDYCIIGHPIGEEGMKAYQQLVGKELTFTNPKTGEQKTVKIGGVFTYDDCHVNSYAVVPVGMPDNVFVSHKFMEDFFEDPIITGLKVDIDRSKEPQIKSEITKLLEGMGHTSYRFVARSDQAAGFKDSMQTMNVLGGGISILLIMVGLINFINVMLTGVYIRRKELAVLESVGMTKKQIRKMLTFEGFYYAVITFGLIMTIGNLPLLYLSKNIIHIADYAVFHYPIGVILAIAAVIFAVCLIVPGLVFKALSKESVTERLHDSQE